MARKKPTRRRSRKSFSILNALESLTYAEIISRGLTGSGVFGFFTGATDLQYSKISSFAPAGSLESMTGTQMQLTGQSMISLGDLLTMPSEAVGQMVGNLNDNIVPMAIGAATTAVTFNVGRRLLRRPINNINRNLMKPLLGAGIKL